MLIFFTNFTQCGSERSYSISCLQFWCIEKLVRGSKVIFCALQWAWCVEEEINFVSVHFKLQILCCCCRFIKLIGITCPLIEHYSFDIQFHILQVALSRLVEVSGSFAPAEQFWQERTPLASPTIARFQKGVPQTLHLPPLLSYQSHYLKTKDYVMFCIIL